MRSGVFDFVIGEQLHVGVEVGLVRCYGILLAACTPLGICDYAPRYGRLGQYGHILESLPRK